MMSTKDEKTGELIFKVMKVGLACQSCQDLGLAAECTHMEQVNIFVRCFRFFFLCAHTLCSLHFVHAVSSAMEIGGKV